MADKQAAYEQQQRHFEEHIRHFEELDNELELFAREHSFILEKNALHSPCRLLRRNGNPSFVIGIQQEGVWFKVKYRSDLPHTVAVVGYWEDESKDYVYELRQELAYFVPFSNVKSNLKTYLSDALAYIQHWTPEVVRNQGAKSRHPSAYYREHGGHKVEPAE